MPKTHEEFTAFAAKLTEFVNVGRTPITMVTITPKFGKKYVKMCEGRNGEPYASVFCFIDYEGNMYKAASWNAPAKHIRGRMDDPKLFSSGRVTPYGMFYINR